MKVIYTPEQVIQILARFEDYSSVNYPGYNG